MKPSLLLKNKKIKSSATYSKTSLSISNNSKVRTKRTRKSESEKMITYSSAGDKHSLLYEKEDKKIYRIPVARDSIETSSCITSCDPNL
ncbi:unnamed protein product [Rhizophagus irregularis]|nr:unnamed protein product [Rhizophagus irregularis]